MDPRYVAQTRRGDKTEYLWVYSLVLGLGLGLGLYMSPRLEGVKKPSTCGFIHFRPFDDNDAVVLK